MCETPSCISSDETPLNQIERQGGIISLSPELEEQKQSECSEIHTEVSSLCQEVRDSVDNTVEFNRILDRFERLGVDGLDEFRNYIINTASPELQEVFLGSGARMVRDYVREKGEYPLNDLDLQIAFGEDITDIIIEQAEEVNAKAEENNAEAEEDNTEAEYVNNGTEQNYFENLDQRDNLIEKLDAINLLVGSGFLIGNSLQDIQQRLSNGDVRSPEYLQTQAEAEQYIEQLISRLKSSREIEEVILPAAQENGNYQEVTAALTALNPSFQSRISAWELGKQYTPETLPTRQHAEVASALSMSPTAHDNEVTQNGSIFSRETQDGTKVSYNFIDGSRALSKGDYTLEAGSMQDTESMYAAQLAFTKVEQEHAPRINAIQTAANAMEQTGTDQTDTQLMHGVLLQELGYTLYSELNLRGKTLTQVQETLSEAYNESLAAMETAQKKYDRELMRITQENQRKFERKDRRIKEILNFLSSIGFTEIPQGLTNQIIAELNMNTAMRNSLGFNQEINFAEGKIGIDSNLGEGTELDLGDKAMFAKFVNKMMGYHEYGVGKTVPPIDIHAIALGTAPVGDKAKFKTQLEMSGLLGMNAITVARNNLQHEIK